MEQIQRKLRHWHCILRVHAVIRPLPSIFVTSSSVILWDVKASFSVTASIYTDTLSFVNNLCHWLEAYESNTQGCDLNNTLFFLPFSTSKPEIHFNMTNRWWNMLPFTDFTIKDDNTLNYDSESAGGNWSATIGLKKNVIYTLCKGHKVCFCSEKGQGGGCSWCLQYNFTAEKWRFRV